MKGQAVKSSAILGLVCHYCVDSTGIFLSANYSAIATKESFVFAISQMLLTLFRSCSFFRWLLSLESSGPH